MTTAELERKILETLSKYEKVLRQQTNAIVKVNKLEFEIEKTKKQLERDGSSDSGLSEDSDENLIQLDAEIEKLKLKLAESESRVELDVRLTNGKVTESHVKALVSTDQEVSELRNKLIEAKAKIKIRKAEIQRTRIENWEKRRQKGNNIENDDLFELKNKLLFAKEENMLANDEVDFLKMQIDTFRLLISIADEN